MTVVLYEDNRIPVHFTAKKSALHSLPTSKATHLCNFYFKVTFLEERLESCLQKCFKIPTFQNSQGLVWDLVNVEHDYRGINS